MQKVMALVRRNILPQLNTGSVAWALHRITGVALAVYLLPHLISINSSRSGREVFDETLGWYAGPLIATSEFLLVMAVAFHMFNGIRIIVVDFFDLSHRQKLLFWAVMAACTVVLLGATFIFLPRILAPV